KPIDVVVCGHLCLDLFPQMEHIPLEALASPGKLFEVGTANLATGGAVSNTGLTLHRLGANVRLMAVVGNDVIGRGILELIERRDSSLSQLITVQKGQSSSYTIVLSPEKVDRIFLYCAGANTNFDSKMVNYEVLDEAKILHLGYPTTLPRLYENDGEDLERLMCSAKVRGAITSLDMTLPDPQSATGRADWRKILGRTLPYTDIFIPSVEEILFMLRREDYDRWNGAVLEHVTRSYLIDLMDEMLDLGAAVAGVKLGEFGMFIKTATIERFKSLASVGIDPDQWSDVIAYHPAFAVNVAGTTGAGDAAYAGFLMAMLRGLPPSQSLRWACAVGACCVEAVDAISGVQSWDAIQARLESGWKVLEKRLE